MAEYTPFTNLRGPAARIAGVSAETVPADQSADVAMTGPDQNRQFAFKVPRGLPGVNAVPADEAVSTYVSAEDTNTRTALLRNGLTGWLHVDGFGADPSGVADSTAAVKAALAAARPGDTVYFRRTGPGGGYRVAGDSIVITTPNVRLMAGPRDAYATSLRCSTPSSTIIQVKAPGFVMENIGLWGDADTAGTSHGSNGQGATITGLELFGDVDGNVDAAIRGATFQYLALGVKLHGRNAEISAGTLFNNCLAGVKHDGPDAVYHTGAAASQNRGNVIRDCRFHNIGVSAATAAVEFTAASLLLHAIIDGNHFDSGGRARHIVIAGSSSSPAKGVSILNSKHTECSADAITLTYCSYPQVSNVQILGDTTSTEFGNGIVVTNSTFVTISDFSIIQVGEDGIVGTGNNGVQIADGRIVQVGRNPNVTTGDALQFDATNANVQVDNVTGDTGDGWFFNGSPGGSLSRMTDCAHVGFLSGGINSSTMSNFGRRGVNAYVEGRAGRVEDIGYGQYDLAAGVAKAIATVTAGATFGSLILEVEISGRDSVTGNAYFSGRRVIRPENGAPNIITLGADAAAGVTLTFAASGTTGVTVSAQTSSATYIGVRVRAVAGGGAGVANSRAVTVTMAAQP